MNPPELLEFLGDWVARDHELFTLLTLDTATAKAHKRSRVPSHAARMGDTHADGQQRESCEGNCPCVADVGDASLRVRCDRHPAVT